MVVLGRGQSRSSADWFSPEPLEVRINGRLYAIPRNYLVYISSDVYGEPENAVLRALWPGLEPLRPDNVHLWERRLPERQIHIVLLRRPRHGYDMLRGFIQLRGARPEAADFGLIRYRSRLEEYYTGDGSESVAPDGSSIVLRCWDYSGRVKASFEVERNCIVEYPLSDGVGLHYRFFMANLDQWREIDRTVRSLVESFRRPVEVRERTRSTRPPAASSTHGCRAATTRRLYSALRYPP